MAPLLRRTIPSWHFCFISAFGDDFLYAFMALLLI